MEYRKLGRTDIDVSLICLGTMTWGVQNTQDEGFEQMDYALERGVNFFDTAEMYAVPPTAETYGKTETVIGNWFAARKNRDKVILATKIAGAGLAWVRGGQNTINRENILQAVESSLARLQTDYIDLYQLHWPNRPFPHFSNHWTFMPTDVDPSEVEANFIEVLETLDELVKQGKIRHIGLSNETSWGTLKYLRLAEEKGLPRMASIQNEYSLMCRIFEPDLAEVALHEDVGLLAWSPLATGLLTGKYANGNRPEGSRWTLTANQSARDTKQAHAAVDAYLAVAAKHGLDPAQMALAFVNEKPFVTANIIGATTMAQLKTNIDSIDIKLSDAVKADIQAVYKDFTRPY